MTGYCHPFFIQDIVNDMSVWNLVVVNKIRCVIHIDFLWRVESEEESKHTVVLYMCLSVVLWIEKLWSALWCSYDSIGDSHFVKIHHIGNVCRKGFFQRFPHARPSINLGVSTGRLPVPVGSDMQIPCSAI
jgi:hypothetical protein